MAPFLGWCRGAFQQYVAFEPDPANFAALAKAVSALGPALSERFDLKAWAVAGADGSLSFALDGSSSSSATAGPGTQVRAIRLDSYPFQLPPTFLKMDIEGAELEALAGARGLIRQHRPTLAISAYHRPEHLWQIPLTLHELLPDAKLHLRPHGCEGWDSICYAIPGTAQ